jgi:elongation factor G
MFGYATTLRNLSSGRANYSMEFFNYQQLPAAIQEAVIKKLNEKKNG